MVRKGLREQHSQSSKRLQHEIKRAPTYRTHVLAIISHETGGGVQDLFRPDTGVAELHLPPHHRANPINSTCYCCGSEKAALFPLFEYASGAARPETSHRKPKRRLVQLLRERHSAPARGISGSNTPLLPMTIFNACIYHTGNDDDATINETLFSSRAE